MSVTNSDVDIIDDSLGSGGGGGGGGIELHPLVMCSTNQETGLTLAQVRERQSIYGPNEVIHGKDRGHGHGQGRLPLTRGRRVMLSVRYQRVAILLATIDALWGLIQWPLRSELVARLIAQLNNPLILLLMASALISLLLGQVENCLSITIVHN